MSETDKPDPISCEEALKQLAEYLDHELEGHAHDEMEHHLETCRACFSRAEFERSLKRRLADAGAEKVPGELQARIRKLLGEY